MRWDAEERTVTEEVIGVTCLDIRDYVQNVHHLCKQYRLPHPIIEFSPRQWIVLRWPRRGRPARTASPRTRITQAAHASLRALHALVEATQRAARSVADGAALFARGSTRCKRTRETCEREDEHEDEREDERGDERPRKRAKAAQSLSTSVSSLLMDTAIEALDNNPTHGAYTIRAHDTSAFTQVGYVDLATPLDLNLLLDVARRCEAKENEWEIQRVKALLYPTQRAALLHLVHADAGSRKK